VLVGLGRAEPFGELRRLFPKAHAMVQDRSWVAVLQGMEEDEEEEEEGGAEEEEEEEEQQQEEETGAAAEPEAAVDDNGCFNFVKGKSVLVRSQGGKLLWEAKVLEIATNEQGEQVGIRVHYKRFSTRFDEWLPPSLLLERNKRNVALMEQLDDIEFKNSAFANVNQHEPLMAERVTATSFIDAPGRARGNVPARGLDAALSLNDVNSSEEVQLAKLRAAVLSVETGLPVGSVDTSETGVWNFELSNAWARRVERARGPTGLMECVLMLEVAMGVRAGFIRPGAAKLVANLPTHTKALADATMGSVSIRIFMLDRE
jgi:hypothetical protein